MRARHTASRPAKVPPRDRTLGTRHGVSASVTIGRGGRGLVSDRRLPFRFRDGGTTGHVDERALIPAQIDAGDAGCNAPPRTRELGGTPADATRSCYVPKMHQMGGTS